MFSAGRLLTQDCLLCAAVSERDILCHACAADLPRLPPERCPNCALPTPHGAICGRCLAHPPHYDATQSAFSYDFPLDRLVQSLKYSHRLALAGFLGHQIAVLAKEVEADLIIPMPLHAATAALAISETAYGRPQHSVPLTLALAYARRHRAELERRFDAEPLFRQWLGALR